VSARPEPHRDQRTIGSWKRTINAAVLIYVTNRTSQPSPQRKLTSTRVAAGATVGGILLALGADPSTLHGLRL